MGEQRNRESRDQTDSRKIEQCPLWISRLSDQNYDLRAEAECKEFELRFKFNPRFKYGWFH